MTQPLRDLFAVWHDTRLIVLVAQTAAVYAAILIPFKMGIPLIPGFSELRPANAIPIVASLLFGPAAAWGAGFGNLIGDCFGSLGPGSLFGFLGNFCYGYVPYLLWGRLGPLSSRREPEPRSMAQTMELALVCVASSAACALVVAWGVDLLGLLPFRILAPAIFANNLVMSLLLAPPLLLFLYPRVKRWGLRYEDIRAAPGVRGAGVADGGCASSLTPHGSPAASHVPFVAFHDVSFTYAGAARPALAGSSLAVQQGESVALMGRSGAGKSTLCYALNGLIPHVIAGHWSGRVAVGGRDTHHRPVWQQAGTVGLVFQDFEAQLVATSVEMELAFPLEQASSHGHRFTPSEMRDRVTRTLALVGLSGLERRNPLSLSGGQRQRLVVASILIREPALVVLDEPMTDLDPAGRRALASLLATMKAVGTALIIAEHDPEDAVTADRICLLDEGAVAWQGSPRELFGQTGEGALPDLGARHGVRPLPLARCFRGLGLPALPLTVEEAWDLADAHRLTVAPLTVDQPPEQPTYGAPVIEVRGASYEYQPGLPVLSDLSVTIREGEFIAVIGQNGSGKSTLATLFNGLLYPTRGCILVDGQDSRKLGAGRLAETVGFVFQNPDHQIFAETIEAEVAFGVRNLGFSSGDCAARVATSLDAVGLGAPEIRSLDPFSLTKGVRQRIAVASVLATRPRVLIFDEPTTGLDAEETDRMMGMLRRLNRDGHTIIMITHNLGLVAAHAHRCLVMHDGRLAADGPTRQVFARLADRDRPDQFGLTVPPLTRFAARWGQTLLTVKEVRAALRRQA